MDSELLKQQVLFKSLSTLAAAVSRRVSIGAHGCKYLSTSSRVMYDFPSIEDCRQGEKNLFFSANEMKSRVEKLREFMVQEKLEACLFTSYHNIAYFSGYLYCSVGRPYGLVITHDDVTTVSSKVDYGQPWRKTHGNNISYTDWTRDNFYVAVKSLIKDARKIGIETDHMNIAALDKMKVAFPGARFIDASVPSMKMRMKKSSEEIALIKAGARIADIGGEAIVEALREGVPEYVVAMNATNRMIKEIAMKFPEADLLDTWSWVQSGPYNSDGAHNPVTSRRIQKGDLIVLNCFPMIHSYFSALERTIFAHQCSDEHLWYWERNCDVHTRGIQLIKPGAKCCDIAAELNEIYAEHDLVKYRTFGYGHSFGILCHYYGREAGLELREDIETILEPGMVLSMEPMIMIPEGRPGAGGYREHDLLIVTENGADDVTKFPYGPNHNIIKLH